MTTASDCNQLIIACEERQTKTNTHIELLLVFVARLFVLLVGRVDLALKGISGSFQCEKGFLSGAQVFKVGPEGGEVFGVFGLSLAELLKEKGDFAENVGEIFALRLSSAPLSQRLAGLLGAGRQPQHSARARHLSALALLKSPPIRSKTTDWFKTSCIELQS